MQHSNSTRRSDGRFDASDGPKAKRIEVWLQPQTVELLDTLTRQWGVGRGKVIDQLLTRGPVPPSAWTKVKDKAAPTDTTPKAKEKSSPKPAAQAVAPEPTPEPEPTTSNGKDWMQELARMQAEHAVEWETTKADAKTVGCKPEDVQRFKATQGLDSNRPLSVEAQQQLRESLDNGQREAKGKAIALEARIKRIQERATPSRLAAMQTTLNNDPEWVSGNGAREYLASALEQVGLKRQLKVTKKLITTLKALVPSATDYALETRFSAKPAVLWGAILRLATLEGEPPTTSCRDFLQWCGFDLIHQHHQRSENQKLSHLFTDHTSIAEAVTLLELPEGTEITAKAIRDAYVKLARVHHPDQGGNAEKFHQIQAAYDRLLLTV